VEEMSTSSIELQQIINIEENSKWLESVLGKIKAKHSGEYVAIRNKKIIAANQSYNKLEKIVKDKGLDFSSTYVEFIPKTGLMLIL
jgi:Family of unknown function (DUF5678)